MCLSCGCGIPEEAHGSDAHITHSDLVRAADAAGISPKQAIRNMKRTLRKSKDAKATAEHVLHEGPPKA